MTLEYKKQAILDSLYRHCQTRTYTSKEVLDKLLGDIKVTVDEAAKVKLLDVVREYKNSGKNLESTINVIYDIFYPASTAGDGKVNLWNPHEP